MQQDITEKNSRGKTDSRKAITKARRTSQHRMASHLYVLGSMRAGRAGEAGGRYAEGSMNSSGGRISAEI